MTRTVKDTKDMIRQMSPELKPGDYVFCSTDDHMLASRCRMEALASFGEPEGWSFILEDATARALGLGSDSLMAWIALRVYSSLEGVGLTAAVSTALADIGIPCNIVAAFHHDHVFVPKGMAEKAMQALNDLGDSHA